MEKFGYVLGKMNENIFFCPVNFIIRKREENRLIPLCVN